MGFLYGDKQRNDYYYYCEINHDRQLAAAQIQMCNLKAYDISTIRESYTHRISQYLPGRQDQSMQKHLHQTPSKAFPIKPVVINWLNQGHIHGFDYINVLVQLAFVMVIL